MPKALIHYFSGTGNSLFAAKQFSAELKKRGYDVMFHAVENGSFDSPDSGSLHIFFFPVYATSVPHIMRKYILNLPDGRKSKAAILSTNGRISTRIRDGYQGWALYEAGIYLRLKNYDVFFSDTLDYPHNVTAAIPPRDHKANSKIITTVSAKLPEIAEKIAGGQVYHRKMFLPNIIWSIPFGILYTTLGRRAIGKLLAADTSCNLCGLCRDKCPVKAIKTDSCVVRWGWNCEGCLRCINTCPKHAIQTSALRVMAMIATAALDPFYFFRRFIPDGFYERLGGSGTGIFDGIMNFALSVLFFAVLDWLIVKLSYIQVFKRISGWGHTRLFGRYSTKTFEDDFPTGKQKP